MRLLGIESSCDETAVAVVESFSSGQKLLGSLVSSQIKTHARYGGVVPEIATREHLRNLPLLVPKLLSDIDVPLESIDGIAVTTGPGLPSALMIGTSYARGLAAATGKPLYGINHLEGHLFSPCLNLPPESLFPFLGLIVSGGHTLLVHAEGWQKCSKLGGTVDDAAGEAFDKVARLLGLPYPGGPEIERIAREGNPLAHDFPQSFPERENYNFSFSGLKTSIRYFIEKNPKIAESQSLLSDVAASFQRAVVEVIVRKTVFAAKHHKLSRVAAAGGVLCNQSLRNALIASCDNAGIECLVATPGLCTDNAAMIASVALARLEAGIPPEPVVDFNPNLTLHQTSSDRPKSKP